MSSPSTKTEQPIAEAPIDKPTTECPKEPMVEPAVETTKDTCEPAEEPVSSEKCESKKEDEKEGSGKEHEGEEELPKRARSSYNLFVVAETPNMKKENPGLSYNEITKMISAKWKALTPEQKQHYEEQAANEKKRIKEAKEKEAKEAKEAKETDSKSSESEEKSRYSLRNSTVLKEGEELAGKKRALETDEDASNKKKCVTSEE